MMKTPWWTQKKCWTTDEIRDFVMNNTQYHIDALVEAGVLERMPSGSGVPLYRVVQPHVHEWRVAKHSDRFGNVDVNCATCPDWKYNIPNRLPIEVPE